MKVDKFNEDLIKKIDFSLLDMNEFEGWKSFSNAHYLMRDFYASSDDNRINNNIHGIKFDRVKNVFGEPNFQDTYNGSFWWILEYKGEKYSIDINTHEGSSICKYVTDDINIMYDKKFNEDVSEFCKQLFKQL